MKNLKKFRDYTKNEKIFAVVLAIIVAGGVLFGSWTVLSTFTGKAAVDKVGFSLDPSTGNFAANQTFDVNLKVESGVNEINVAAAYLKFNQNELELKSVKRNTANQSVSKPAFESDLGSTANVADANAKGEVAVVGLTGDQYHDTNGWFKGDDVLATLTFIGKKSGVSTEVSFDQGRSSLARVSDNTNVLESAVGGRYTIGETGNQPSITLDPAKKTQKVNQDFKVKLKVNSLDNEINVAATYLKFNSSEVKVKTVVRHTANQNTESNPIFESDLGSSTDLNQVNQTGELVVVGLTGDAYHNEHGWFKGEGILADITFEGLKNNSTAKVTVDQGKSSLVRVSDNQNILGFAGSGSYSFSDTQIAGLTATIISPQDSAEFVKGDLITFKGEADRSAQVAVLASDNLKYKWTSDKDGELGTELKFDKNDLSVNQHKITFEITDPASKTDNKATDTVTITVSDLATSGLPGEDATAVSEEDTGGVAGFVKSLPTSGIVFGVIILIALIVTGIVWFISRRKLAK